MEDNFKIQMSKTTPLTTEASKRKILYVITKSVMGGAGRYVLDLAEAFAKDYDVVVAAGGHGPLIESLHKHGVRTIEITSFQRDINLFKEFHSFFELLSILKQERPDIVHVNSSKAGGTGAFAVRVHNLLRRKTPCRVIFTAHGWAFKEDRSFLSKLIIKKLSWLTVAFSHAVITVSEDDKRRASWMPFVQKKLHTIRNGITPPHFASREESSKTLDLSHEKGIRIGTIAELHDNKGLLYALRAMNLLKKESQTFSYTIIGEGEERTHLETFVHLQELDDVVHLVGAKPNASTYLEAFDIFLLPSIKEGLPYTILEAGSAGLPVVATSIGGIPEIIDDMKSGILVRPKNEREIATALTLFINDEAKRKAFGEALREKIKNEYALSGMVTKTGDLYRSLFPKKKASSAFDNESLTR